MKKHLRLCLVATGLTVMSACNSAGEPPSAQSSNAGHTPAALQATAATDIPSHASNIEAAWTLEVDHARLDAITDTKRIKAFIALPDQRRLDFEVNHIEGIPPRVLRGQLYEGAQPHSGLTLSRRHTRLAGSFRVGQDEYDIQSITDGGALLLLRDKTEPPPPGQPILPDNNK